MVIKEQKGFTLVEMLISLTLFAMIIIMAFDAMGSIGVLRTRVSSRLDLNNELYSASEKFIDIIKTGGGIDYEEYWNRTTVGTTTSSGHYDVFSGFGNYGSGGALPSSYGEGMYYCVSGSWVSMGTNGCLSGSTEMQRYGQYRQQFIDYNANANNDTILGDEDNNGNIRWDDDDEDLWMGPSAFTGGVGMKELYLIKKWSQVERTYLRWILTQDQNAPWAGSNCVLTGTYMGSGNCLGNIQVLKLVGRDLGLSHTWETTITSTGRYDGVTDTWECHKDYNCTGVNNLPTGVDSEWVNIFPGWVNVRSVDFYPYPEKDFRYAWKESADGIVLNSYVRIKMTLGLAWERRKQIKGPPNEMTLTTTVNLSK
jgi:prepilin-type N-terminal cleavage/methylation domain-containing protein